MPTHTYNIEVTTSGKDNDTVRNSNLRLSYLVQCLSGENAVYIVNNSADDVSKGAVLTSGKDYGMNWRDDGFENVNQKLVLKTSTGVSDVRVIETLAKNRESFLRITQGER